jgi:serine/threonine protein kinase
MNPSYPSGALQPGDEFAGHRIEGLLGRGAMGALYRATDLHTGTVRAIKTLALAGEFDGAALAEARDRFLRESEAATRLAHPCIVAINSAGEVHGMAYLAMELLAGSDLERHTRPGHLLPLDRVLHIGACVADALAYAHQRGVVHRDIKPANVMFDIASGQVKVTDFGVARLADATRTRTGVVLGTPSYMAPEQLAGNPADGRSDLYALAAMLFQLLSGRLPYEGATMGALLRAVAQGTRLDLQALRPDLPAGLAALLHQTLSRAPQDRPADGHALSAALRHLMPGSPA